MGEFEVLMIVGDVDVDSEVMLTLLIILEGMFETWLSAVDSTCSTTDGGGEGTESIFMMTTHVCR